MAPGTPQVSWVGESLHRLPKDYFAAWMRPEIITIFPRVCPLLFGASHKVWLQTETLGPQQRKVPWIPKPKFFNFQTTGGGGGWHFCVGRIRYLPNNSPVAFRVPPPAKILILQFIGSMLWWKPQLLGLASLCSMVRRPEFFLIAVFVFRLLIFIVACLPTSEGYIWGLVTPSVWPVVAHRTTFVAIL